MQIFPELPAFIHDCSEEAMRACVPSLPYHSEWNENDSIPSYIPSYIGTAVKIPAELLQWNTLYVSKEYMQGNRSIDESSNTNLIANTVKVLLPKECINVAGLAISMKDAQNTVRIVQTLNKEVELPIKRYPNWSVATDLQHLRSMINKAKMLERMLIVVCSKQNASLWLPQGFHRWAPIHPRLMFASIDRDVANQGDPELCEELLGFQYIDGVCFCSHVTNEKCRAFNGTGVSMDDIFTSLLTRYRVNCFPGGPLSSVEKDGMTSRLEVNWNAALAKCTAKLRVEPVNSSFSFRLESARDTVMEVCVCDVCDVCM